MTHDEIRKRHSHHLHSYRQSAEYAAYAGEIGIQVPQGDLPSLLGKRWEIDKETYWEFLEVLPPLAHRGGSFYLSEFTFGDITTKYTKEGDKYYCEFARYPAREHSLRPHQQRAVDDILQSEGPIAIKPPNWTPWGHPDTIKEIAPGIIFYSTPSHGGYWLSPARVAAMPKPLRDFQPFAGRSWYEEDADWSIVALAFPQFFPPDAIAAARQTLKHYKPELYQQVVVAGTEHGRK